MRRLLAVSLVSLALFGCSPTDKEYCQGSAGTAGYAQCIQNYHTQEAVFDTDRASCHVDADMAYPPVVTRANASNTAAMQSEFDLETKVDRMKDNLVRACMMQKGWNSPYSWQEGRHPVQVMPGW